MPRRSLTPNVSSLPSFGFSRQTFRDLDQFIRDNENSAVKVKAGIDLLARAMVLVTKGLAQEKSAGPVAPRQRSRPELANRIPVQRITGAYFGGWKVVRIRSGHWALRNDSFEAYLIEYGIYQRTRRPIMKMSLVGMLRFIQTTRAAERFFDHVLATRRNPKGQFVSFANRLGPSILAADKSYATFHGNRRGAFVHRNVLAGPKGRLPS